MPPANLPHETQAQIIKCMPIGNLEKAEYVSGVALRYLDEAKAERLAEETESEKAAPVAGLQNPSPVNVSPPLNPEGQTSPDTSQDQTDYLDEKTDETFHGRNEPGGDTSARPLGAFTRGFGWRCHACFFTEPCVQISHAKAYVASAITDGFGAIPIHLRLRKRPREMPR